MFLLWLTTHIIYLKDSGFKERIHPEIKMMSLFAHCHVFPNMFLSSVEDKWSKI